MRIASYILYFILFASALTSEISNETIFCQENHFQMATKVGTILRTVSIHKNAQQSRKWNGFLAVMDPGLRGFSQNNL